MSMHPSLRGSKKGKKHQAVMKRIERLKWLKEREQWTEGDKVFGLPKIKTVRIKMKKEKGAEKAAEGAAAPAAKGAAPAGKAAAPAAKEAKK